LHQPISTSTSIPKLHTSGWFELMSNRRDNLRASPARALKEESCPDPSMSGKLWKNSILSLQPDMLAQARRCFYLGIFYDRKKSLR